MKNSVCGVSLFIMAVLLFSGCDDKNKSEKSTAIPVTASNETTVLVGSWKGPAGSDQSETVFMLNTYGVNGAAGENVCGELTWANGDKRFIRYANFSPDIFTCSLSGTSSSAAITDYWTLFYDGTSLSGTAKKYTSSGASDGSYSVFLSRQ